MKLYIILLKKARVNKGAFAVCIACVCMCTEFIRTERVKVVGQRYYGLYMSCVQNAVASNKYKCEGYVCNDEIPCTMILEDRQRGRDNKLNKNKLSSHIHTANRRLSVLYLNERP